MGDKGRDRPDVTGVGRLFELLLVALPLLGLFFAVAFLGAVVLTDESTPEWLLELVFGTLGVVYVVVVSALPLSLLGYGVWSLWMAGRVTDPPQTTDRGVAERAWDLLGLLVWRDRRTLDDRERFRRRGLLCVAISAVMSVVLLNGHGVL